MLIEKMSVAPVVFLLLTVALWGAEEQTPPTAYIDPATVDTDFAIQGEYAGEIADDDDNQKAAAHVIARGDGKFRVVGYLGGLPGDGWDRGFKREGEGALKDGVLEVQLPDAKIVLKDGVMSVLSGDDAKLGELKKTMRKSPTLGLAPPEGAVVLFDGKSVDEFPGAQMTADGLLKQGATSGRKFQSGTLHLEFLLSYMPRATQQGRSNSGCYLQGRYEVQILDSFGLDGKNNECGGIYEVKGPILNMCYPPLCWQTYDIDFTAAKYDDQGAKTADALMTVKHNGVVIQKDVPVPKSTRAAPVPEGADPGPLYLQDHNNPVRFRNIWFLPK